MTEPRDLPNAATSQGRVGTMSDISVATYSLTEGDNGAQISIVFSDGSAETVTDHHSNFELIKRNLYEKPEGYAALVHELANIAKTVGRKFKKLSPRVTTDGNDLFFDGDAIHGSLSQYILKLLREDAEKSAAFFSGQSADSEASDVTWEALVKFLELLYSNPNPQSRESLYEFITRYGLTIRKDGHFIAYKGLQDDFGSINKGYGIVDGVEVNGTLFNKPGSVLSFPRQDVESNTAVGCARGLHAGTHSYASSWGRGGKLVTVAINPMNVVSVPDDCTFQKIRVCEYEIIAEVDPLEDAQATSGWDSSSFWAGTKTAWDDNYQGDRGESAEVFERVEEGDEISFDYISKDGLTQTIDLAEVDEVYSDYLKAFVPAKDGYRTFNARGISNLVILGEDEGDGGYGDDDFEDDGGYDDDGFEDAHDHEDFEDDAESEADEQEEAENIREERSEDEKSQGRTGGFFSGFSNGSDFFSEIIDALEDSKNGGDLFGFKIEDFPGIRKPQGSGLDDILKGAEDLIPTELRNGAEKLLGGGDILGGLLDIFGGGAPKDEQKDEAEATPKEKPAAQPTPAPAKPEAPKSSNDFADLAEGDLVSFDYVSESGSRQHIAEARVSDVEGELFKAFVPAKDGYRSFRYEGVSNLASAETEDSKVFDRIADLKLGDEISVELSIDGETQRIDGAKVLVVAGTSVTVRLKSGGYRSFTANDVARFIG